jgi:hypothetical protein
VLGSDEIFAQAVRAHVLGSTLVLCVLAPRVGAATRLDRKAVSCATDPMRFKTQNNIVGTMNSHEHVLFCRATLRIASISGTALPAYVGAIGFTWSHLISLGFTWFHLVSLCFTWFHLMELGLGWFRLISVGFTWFHLVHLVSIGCT